MTTTDQPTEPIGVLVGYDGSELAGLALEYGAIEATRRNTTLTVVSVYTIPTTIYPNLASLPSVPDEERVRRAAEDILAEAAEQLRDHPGTVVYHAEPGHPVGVLARLSETAEIAVVGSQGRGGFLGRALGSVSTGLPPHAHCPTVVVPHEATVKKDAPVVAAVDGSVAAGLAIKAAAEVAHACGVELRIVTALPAGTEFDYWYPELQVSADITQRRKQELASGLEFEVSQMQQKYPQLKASAEVFVGNPAAIISTQTEHAQLTVLGTRGRGALRSTLLGSVSRTVLHHAAGPVMVVPG